MERLDARILTNAGVIELNNRDRDTIILII